MYTMLFSKYRERVAAATTARDFANMWLVILAPLFFSTVLYLCFEVFYFFHPGDSEILDLLLEIGDFALLWIGEAWYLMYVFRDPDVRFWDPLIYLQKKQPDGLDIEKIRKMHTDDDFVIASIETHIFILLFSLVFQVLFVLGFSIVAINHYFF